MLHEFRQTLGVGGLRAINQHLVGQLLRQQGMQPHAVALMDATDLPAACSGFKRKFRRLHRRACGAGRAHAQDGPEPLVRWLQETPVAVVAAHEDPSVRLVPLVSWITPANVAEGGLLLPSLRWCRQCLGWWPGIVVADMG